jgi:hypothetical protein
MRGCGYPVLWPLDLPPYEGMRLNSSQGLWAGRSPAQVPRSGAGGPAHAPAPALFAQLLCVRGPLWACQEGLMYQKLVRFAGLSGTRSCQDASIEVHEVVWKRPSSGGKHGGHHSPPTPIWAPGVRGVSFAVYRLPFPGVAAHHLSDFQGRLRATTSVESVYFICICAHQTGYRGQWGD